MKQRPSENAKIISLIIWLVLCVVAVLGVGFHDDPMKAVTGFEILLAIVGGFIAYVSLVAIAVCTVFAAAYWLHIKLARLIDRISNKGAC